MPKQSSLYGYILLGAGMFLLVSVGYQFLVPSVAIFESTCVKEAQTLADAQTAFEFGEYYFDEQHYDLECARVGYAQAARLDPEVDMWLWYQFGRIDFLEGDFDGALYKFDRQIEYFGDRATNVHYMLGLTYGYRARAEGRESDWRLAEESFKKYLTLNPISPWARTDLAWIFFAQGKYEEMKPVLAIGLEGNPEHPWLLNMYGLALLNTGEPVQARTYFINALDAAEKLTPRDWGNSYPGNDPGSWPEGLRQMKEAIMQNIALSYEEQE